MSREFPGYQILRLLGKGGMGAVYLGRRHQDGLMVAIKTSHGTLGRSGIERLRREGELLSRVSSPHLPTFVEHFEAQEQLVLVMSFVEGSPLHEVWRAEAPGPEERLALVKRAVPGVARGLLELHRLGILHRDLKPANVIVADCGGVLVDLGLARGPDVRTLTVTGLTLGTPDYLPPEQISSEKVTDSADLYQLALVIHDLFLGPRRGPGDNAIDQAVRRSVCRFPDPRGEHPWLPTELTAWMLDSLHPDPAGRPPTRDHLLSLLEILPEASLESPPQESPLEVGQALEARTFAAVARSREQARKTSWSDAKSLDPMLSAAVASWKQHVIPEPERAPARAAVGADRPRGTRWIWGILLLLGVVTGLVGTLPERVGGMAAPLVFRLEKRSLVLDRGEGEGLRLKSSGVPFRRGDRGEWRLELDGSVQLPGLLEFEQRGETLQVYLIDSVHSLGARLTRGVEGLRFRISLGEAPELLVRLGSSEGGMERRGSGVMTFELPESLLEASSVSLDLALPGQPTGRTLLNLEEVARAALDPLRIPPLAPAERSRAWGERGVLSFQAESLWTKEQAVFLETKGPELAAWMGWSGLDEDRRQGLYEKLAPYVFLEWMSRRTSLAYPWLANPSLGPLLALRATPNLAWAAGPGRLEQRDFALAVRIGPEGRYQQGVRDDRTRTPGVWDDQGRFWIHLETLEPGLPRRVEVGLQAGGGDVWGTLLVELGGRTLRFPLLEDDLWRYHSLPPRWYQEAVSGDGSLDVGFSFSHEPGQQVPGNFFLSRLSFRTLFQEAAQPAPSGSEP